jgi:4-carboxymuconolactone decarboxylase
MMKVIKTGELEAQESTSKIFRGRVSIQRITGEDNGDILVSVINFSRGAVNVFHTHTFNQILYVIGGKGIVATEKESVTVTPGTWIIIPAGERHSHGATKDSVFSHISIRTSGETSF